MRIKAHILGLGVALVVLGAVALVPHATRAAVHPYRDVAIAWHTDLPSDSIVFFSMIPLHPDDADVTGYQHAETIATSTDHLIHLQGLVSGTTYYYMAVSRTPEAIPIYTARGRFTLP